MYVVFHETPFSRLENWTSATAQTAQAAQAIFSHST